MSAGILESTRPDRVGTRSRTTTAEPATTRRAPAAPMRGGAHAEEEPRTSGTAPFVLLIMVLLTSGLVATLWLSTAAAADSYRLDSARQVARDLSEQTERLHRDVEAAQSAPALAAAARRLGMVPGGEPAVLLVAPDGSSRVIGDPRPARAAAVPVPGPAPAAPPAGPAAAAQAAQGGAPAPAPSGAAAAEDRLTAVPGPTAPEPDPTAPGAAASDAASAATDPGARPDTTTPAARADAGGSPAAPDARTGD